MKDTMPEPAPNMYGHPVHQHQQQMPTHSPALPTPPPQTRINHHIPPEQPPVPGSNTGHYHSFHAEGGVANMDLEEPEPEIPSYVNSKPMHEYHNSRRYVSSPHHTNKIEQDQNSRRYFPPQSQPSSWNHSQYNAAGPSSHGGMILDDPNADNLDAAARKKLPVWIRAVLEKMEKESASCNEKTAA
jgi:hypothetical protein